MFFNLAFGLLVLQDRFGRAKIKKLITHIMQVLLVMLQTICTPHKWCSSLIRITSNGVVEMNYSICKVVLRNVGYQALLNQFMNAHFAHIQM